MFGALGLVVRTQARYDKRRRLHGDEDIRLDSAEVWPHYRARPMSVLRFANVRKHSPIVSFAFQFASRFRLRMAVHRIGCIATLMAGALLAGCAHEPLTRPDQKHYSGPSFCGPRQRSNAVPIRR